MKTLLLDIETAPHKVYAWGLWGQNIAINQIEEPGYTLSWAAKWYGDNGVMYMDRDGIDPFEMIAGVYELINEADVLVHYNGNKFDIPILNQEFLMYGFRPPAPSINIDLLNTVKKRFRFPSRKLDYVARALNLEGKLQHKGMDLWRECMNDDREAWKTMREYNIQDVILLEQVYEKLQPWVTNHPNFGLFVNSDRPICPNCGSNHLQKRGTYYTKTLSYQRYHCQECGAWSRERNTNLNKEQRPNVLSGIN